jgi:hypothetical protein
VRRFEDALDRRGIELALIFQPEQRRDVVDVDGAERARTTSQRTRCGDHEDDEERRKEKASAVTVENHRAILRLNAGMVAGQTCNFSGASGFVR